MTRITDANQVLVLLRAHLERADKTLRAKRSSAPRAKRTALQRVTELAVDKEARDGDIRRALVAGILIEEFGAGFAADVRFQDVVTNVLRVISDHPESRQIIDNSLEQLVKNV